MPSNDSGISERLAEKHERNRERRLEAVSRWVEFIRNNPPEVWGPQQNAVVNSQIESARETGLSVEHRQKTREFARAMREGDESDDPDADERTSDKPGDDGDVSPDP